VGDLGVLCCFLAHRDELVVVKIVSLPETAKILKMQKAQLTRLLSLFKWISERRKCVA